MIPSLPRAGRTGLALALLPLGALAQTGAGEFHPGERLDPSTYFPGVVEDMATVLEREAARPADAPQIHRMRGPEDTGEWRVPSIRRSAFPHSGEHYIYNHWGDLRMSIEFPAPVNLEGAFVAGHGGSGNWAEAITVVGYRGEAEVARTFPFRDIDDTPTWFAMDLAGVDRVVFEALPADGVDGGWYGLDDLTFVQAGERTVLDFEDLPWRAELAGTDYAGLSWPRGMGSFAQLRVVPPPVIPPGVSPGPVGAGSGLPGTYGGGGTLPTLGTNFVGPASNDPGAGWIPPDTHGAIGPDHYVSVVNQHMSVYDRSGNRLISTSLQGFFNTGGSAGDPRVAWDHHANRWIVIACNFNAANSGIFLAVSTTSSATGSWFKTFVQFNQGSDSGNWTDYPTLGFDQFGIYSGAYMVGGGMSLFAIDKAPLVAASPSLGTVTAFRNLPYERAIQPCVTHGTPGNQYFISTPNTSQLRIRRLTGPLTTPLLQTVANLNITSWSTPPDSPQLGSNVVLDALDGRLMNAVFRNGSIWAAHGINRAGRGAARWYEVSISPFSVVQEGEVRDPELYFSFPGIAVNSAGDVAMGLTGSSPNIYAACYYTGRLASDPPAEMAVPVSYKAGLGPYPSSGGSGDTRWGDYSVTNVDPLDDTTLWTIQEYARNNGNWGTWIAELEFPDPCGQPQNYCSTSPNSVGPGALIQIQGSNSIAANDLQLQAFGMPPFQVGIFYYGPNQIDQPFGNGRRCVGGTTYRLPIVGIDLFGFVSYDIDYGNLPPGGGIQVGSTWNFQFWYRDPAAGGAAFNLSDAVSVPFCP